MARIKYQPSSKVKPFNPIQISKEGITEMRRENNRVIQGLQNNFQAEKEQQARDRAAMQENAQLERERIERDRAVEVENLKNEEISMSRQAQVDAQQDKFDAEAQETFLNTIVDFSQTVAATMAKNTAKMVKDQTQEAMAKDLTPYREDYLKYNEAEQMQVQGGITLDANAQEEGVEFPEQPLNTWRAFISNPGLGDVQKRVLENRMLEETYPLLMGKALQGIEAIYDDGAGGKFAGIQAQRDPGKMGIVGSQVLNDLAKRAGVNLAEPGRHTKGLTAIQGTLTSLQNQANTKAISDAKGVLEQQAADHASANTTQGYTIAFHKMKMISKDAAHTFMQQQGAKLGTELEAIDRMDLLGDGRRYSEVWPNRWKAIDSARRANETKAIKANMAFKKAQLQQMEAENIDIIRQGYIENFPQQQRITVARSHAAGLPPSELMKSVERSVLSEVKDQEQQNLMQQIRFSSLDQSYVNSIQDPAVKKQAIEALTQQESRLFGAPKAQVKKGYIALAQDVLGLEIGPNTKDSFRVVQMANEMLKQHKERYAINQDFNATINSISQDRVDAAAGKKNFLTAKEIGGGRTRYDHEKSDEELAQQNLMIDKRMVTYGAGVASQAYLLATEDEMELTIQSAQSNGTLIYPKGVLRVAEAYGLKPSEVYNEHRKAINLVTGENKPFITPSIGTDVFDGLTPANRKVYIKSQEFLSYQLGQRVQANSTGTLNNHVRRSMPGGDPMQPLQDLVLSGEGGFTSANRGMAGDSPGGIPDLDRKTVGEWKQLYRQGWNALGGPQFIESTFNGAVNRLKLSDDTVMSGNVQMELFNELILGGVKRPRLSAYLNGTSDNLEGALEDMSLEFASVANPKTGITSYPNVGGNAASINSNSMALVLQQLRNRLN